MSRSIYAVFGASGFGRQVMPIARDSLRANGRDGKSVVFVDDAPVARELNGHTVMRYEEFRSIAADAFFVAIAVSDGLTRKKIAARCLKDGMEPWTITANNVVITDDVVLGHGSILSHFSLLTCNIRVGDFFLANHYSHVSHDCIIGDYVTFAPGVRCNGNVHIGNFAYLGANAVIKQGTPERPLKIGQGSVVGMGAVVTRDVPPGITVVGNPARPM